MPTFNDYSFTGTNGDAITGAFTRAPGDEPGGGAGVNIQGNRGRPTSSSGNVSRYYGNTAPSGADHSCTATFVVPNSQDGVDAYAVWVRMSTSAQTGYRMEFYRGSNTANIVRFLNGAESTIGSAIGGLTDNNTYRFTLSATGSTIAGRIFRVGTSEYLTSGGTWSATPQDAWSVTNSDVTAAGRVGFSLRNASSNNHTEIDDFFGEEAGGGATNGSAFGRGRALNGGKTFFGAMRREALAVGDRIAAAVQRERIEFGDRLATI